MNMKFYEKYIILLIQSTQYRYSENFYLKIREKCNLQSLIELIQKCEFDNRNYKKIYNLTHLVEVLYSDVKEKMLDNKHKYRFNTDNDYGGGLLLYKDDTMYDSG